MIKDLKELGTKNGNELAGDGDRWRSVVVAAMGLNGLKNALKINTFTCQLIFVYLSTKNVKSITGFLVNRFLWT